MVDIGGNPRLEHTKIDQSTKTADMLRADIALEKDVTAEYDRATREIAEPDLKKLLARIRDHELYHADVFSDLLRGEEEQGRKR
jgi:rubrerythrin